MNRENFVDRENETIDFISKTLNCKKEDISKFVPVNEGLTNTSFIFTVKDKKYVYRHPGVGTESIINRDNELKSLEIAKRIGLDPTYIKMNKEGYKISSFYPFVRYPNYHNVDDSCLIIKKMKELHNKNIKVKYKFQPWEDSLKIVKTHLNNNDFIKYGCPSLEKEIKKIYNQTKRDHLNKRCFCHCDTYSTNWLIGNKGVILIDWEYAGLADPAVDIAYYIVDTMYDIDEAINFIKLYLGKKHSKAKFDHYFKYIPIVAYYWFIWALYREKCGFKIGKSLYNWYFMAKKYSSYILKTYE